MKERINILYLLIFLFPFKISFAQNTDKNLPTINWNQGDLSEIKWGMSKDEVERVLGVKLKLLNNNNSVNEYTLNFKGKWLDNHQLIFVCNSFFAEMAFYRNQLYTIWFCSDKNVKLSISRIYGEGIPGKFYSTQTDWYDENSKLSFDSETNSVWIENWKINDQAHDRETSKEGYERYISWTE